MEKSPRSEMVKLDSFAGLSPTQQRCLKRVYDKSPVATIVVNHHEDIIFSNSAARELFHRRHKNFATLFSPENKPSINELSPLIQGALNGRTSPTAWHSLHISKWPSDLEVHVAPLPLSEDKDFVLCQIREAVSSPSEPEELRERRRLRALIKNLPIAVLLYNSKAEILEFNQQVLEVMERHRWDSIDDTERSYRVVDAQGRPLPREEWPLVKAMTKGQAGFEGEIYLDFQGRQKTLFITVKPIVYEGSGEAEYLVTGEDITRRAEESRQKDDFLTVASHELRGPLTPLAGLIQLARKQAEAAKLVDPQLMRRAESQVERLHRLIDGLLDLSRIERGRLAINRQEVNLTELVARIVEPWVTGPQKSRVEVELPKQELKASVDPDRIDQVLTNVIDNALKHGRTDGTVYIKLERSPKGARLTVRDEGDGIPEELLRHVFDRFVFGSDQKGEGRRSMSLGLGLFLARQIVEGHGGTIELKSAANSPTVVTIELPVVSPESNPLIA